MRGLGRLLLLPFALGVLILSGIVIASFVPGAHWALDFMSQFLLPATTGLLALFVILLVATLIIPATNRGRGFLAALALIFMVLGFLSIRTTPNMMLSPATRTTFTVFQQNIWMKNPTPVAVVEEIRRTDPDIAALIELPIDRAGLGFDTLSDVWPYVVKDAPGRGRKARLRLISKFPVSNSSIYQTASELDLLQADVETPGGPLRVIVVHFTRPWPYDDPTAQMRQVEELEAVVNAHDGPTLVMGDFNAAPWGRIVKDLRARTGLALASNPMIATWPARVTSRGKADTMIWPKALGIPIDLALTKGGIDLVSHTPIDPNGSDHRAIVIDMTLTRPTSE